MPPVPDDTTEIIVGWVLKIGGFVVTFIGGIITATATITRKLQRYDIRIASLELNQHKCQSEVLKSLGDKLDNLPDNIGDKMEEKFNRVHDRIDKLLLDKNAK